MNDRQLQTVEQVGQFLEGSKTKPVVSRIGERVRPGPKGQPGYIRIGTVHQGDLNGQKGVYHINTVDEVTQWEIVASVETRNGSVVRKNLGYTYIPQACKDGECSFQSLPANLKVC